MFSSCERDSVSMEQVNSKRPKQQISGGAFTNESILAEELTNLTFQERESVYADLHGVADSERIADEPADIQAKIDEVHRALQQIPPKEKRAFERAIFLKPKLRNDITFLKLFLKRERYDACKTARRLCGYFTQKLELWGEDKLVKPIMIEDLDDDDLDCLRSGGAQLLSSRDSAGRLISLVQPSRFVYRHWKNHVRVSWYQCMSRLLDFDEEITLGHMVSIVNLVNFDPKVIMQVQHFEVSKQSVEFCKYWPYRLVGQHMCYNDPLIRAAVSFFERLVTKDQRLHMRFHYGSVLESQYTLQTFGVKVEGKHLSEDNELRKRVMEEYIAKQTSKEASIKQREQLELSKGITLGEGNTIMTLLETGRCVSMLRTTSPRIHKQANDLRRPFWS